MSEVPKAYATPDLRSALLIAYVLFVLALFNGATAILGIVLVYIKRGEARGTLWESHARNLIRVFWISVAVFVVLLAALLQGFGGLFFSLYTTNGNPPPALVGALALMVPALALAFILFAVWYLYRTLRGLVRALEGTPY